MGYCDKTSTQRAEDDYLDMRCKIIPFPAAAVRVGTRAEPILARHHILLEVGGSRYELDVMAFVSAVKSAAALVTEGATVRGKTGPAGTEREAPSLVEVGGWSETLGQGWRAGLRLAGSERRWDGDWREVG